MAERGGPEDEARAKIVAALRKQRENAKRKASDEDPEGEAPPAAVSKRSASWGGAGSLTATALRGLMCHWAPDKPLSLDFDRIQVDSLRAGGEELFRPSRSPAHRRRDRPAATTRRGRAVDRRGITRPGD
jgi:hypothetical protein